MKSVLSTGLILIFTLLLGTTLKAQDQLPQIELPDVKGNIVNLADYATNGKITVINFWATWCTPCKKELNNIADMYAEWQELYDMELVAISIDDSRNKAKVKTYINGQGWEYDILLDVNGILKQRLNFQSIPYTLIIDQNGKVVDRHSGYIDGDEYELEEKLEALSN